MVASAPGTVKGITDAGCSPRLCLLTFDKLEAEAWAVPSEPEDVFDLAGECNAETTFDPSLWWWWLLRFPGERWEEPEPEELNWDSLDFKFVATPDIMPIALSFKGREVWGETALGPSGVPENKIKCVCRCYSWMINHWLTNKPCTFRNFLAITLYLGEIFLNHRTKGTHSLA